jgi:hypothetical protein
MLLLQKPGFSASNKPCQANIRSNFGKFNSSDTKNLVSYRFTETRFFRLKQTLSGKYPFKFRQIQQQ